MIILNHPQGSAAWLQARAGVITASRFSDARVRTGGPTEQQALYIQAIRSGASELAALIEAGYKKKPTASVIDRALSGQPVDEPGAPAIKYAWTIALERIAGTPLDDTFKTWQMERGQVLEAPARVAYEARTGAMVDESGLIITDDGRFGYSSDGFIDDDGMVEIKCPAACDKLGFTWTNPDEAANEYIDQINGGLWITGRKWCDLIVYCPWLESVGKELFIKRIERDDNAIDALAADLWQFKLLTDKYEQSMRKEAA